MSSISRIWNKIKESPAIVYPSFEIASDRVLNDSSPESNFVADKCYFEIRICEQFLKNRREYWNEFNPLTIVLSDFIYDGEKHSFPFVVGPDLLKNLEQLQGDENVRYTNTRVVGPTPYRGDQIALFVGLFRIMTKDWAKQTLNLLESVAKSFDSSKLTSYLNIADPLIDGIEGFFGMGKQIEFRLGQREEFVDPHTHHGNTLKPCYMVLIRDEKDDVADKNKKIKLWVKDSRLFYGENESNLIPYIENDYVLYQLSLLEERNDYTTFDFHKQWNVVFNAIWNESREKAHEEYQLLISQIRRCPDLIPNHMKKLQLIYRAKAIEEFKAKDMANTPFPDISSDSFNNSVGALNNFNFHNETRDGIAMSNDLIIKNSSVRENANIPIELEENGLHSALNSKSFNNEIIDSIDIDNLNEMLSIETPFSKFA